MDEHDQDLAKTAPNLLREIEKKLEILEKKSQKKEDINFAQYVDPLLLDIDQFQSEPYFLDSILEKTVLFLCKQHAGQSWPPAVFYQLTKVRGYKVVCRFLPVNVDQLVGTVEALEAIHADTTWQTQYFLLLKLSMLVLTPFPLRSIQENLPERIYECALSFFARSGKERNAATLLLARLITRPDVKKDFVPKFYKMAEYTHTDAQTESTIREKFYEEALVECSVSIVSLVASEDFELLDSKFFDTVGDKCTNLKLVVKNLTRYELLRLSSPGAAKNTKTAQKLFEICTNTDSSRYRHAGAKGFARYLERISDRSAVNRMIKHMFDSFSPKTRETRRSKHPEHLDTERTGIALSMSHGVLLILAELLRKGILDSSLHFEFFIDTILPDVLLEKKYENAAKDAVCYGCWAMSRAYRTISEEHLNKMLETLIYSACLDRDATVRRAAGAAVQEIIGRHGHVIGETEKLVELVKNLDFFSLSVRSKALISVANKAHELGYVRILDFAAKKSLSQDPEIRRLTARFFGELSRKNRLSHETTQGLIETFFKMYRKEIPRTGHGPLCCIAELLDGFTNAPEKVISQVLSTLENIEIYHQREKSIFAETFAYLFGHFVKIYGNRYRMDCQNLLTKSMTMTIMRPESSKSKSKDGLDETICMENAQMAIRNCPSDLFSRTLIQEWCQHTLKGKDEFAIILGTMAHVAKSQYGVEMLDALRNVVKGSRQAGGITRAEAIKSLCNILVENQTFTDENLDIFLYGLDDFTVSTIGGEVGSFVRVESIRACQKLWVEYVSKQSSSFADTFKHVFVSRLFRMSFEVLDKVREEAASCLVETFPGLFDKTKAEKLKKMLKDGNHSTKEYFDLQLRVWPVLDDEKYRDQFSLGVIKLCGAIHGSAKVLENGKNSLLDLLENGHWDICCYLYKYLDARNARGEPTKLTKLGAQTWQTIIESGLEIPLDIVQALKPKILSLSRAPRGFSPACLAILTELLTSSEDLEILVYLSELLSHDDENIRIAASESIFGFTMNNEKFLPITELLENVDWDSITMNEIQKIQLKLIHKASSILKNA